MVSSIESNHKQVENARKGLEVCIKIEAVSGDAPRLYGRHFDHTDLLVSKVKLVCGRVVSKYVHCSVLLKGVGGFEDG